MDSVAPLVPRDKMTAGASSAQIHTTSSAFVEENTCSYVSDISREAAVVERTDTPASGMALPPRGLLDRKVILAIRDQPGSDDPELSEFFSDFLELGPMKAMHHLGRPSVTSRLAVLMAEATRDPCKGRAPVPGWCR